ncbi:MAG: DUF167 family protein [Aquamicrobium sp.]|uniref:DUF167 family protein n=1 Tax=Aquamicrobium sp. TaxID=1872579 RepID=UPI00349EB7E0|nr:DUF167 family protein [Aquamicrobium sp.]
MRNALDCFYRPHGAGFDLFVRLTPKSARDGLEGVETAADGRRHVKARVRAVPEDGKANKALIKLLAKELGVPASRIAIVAGETARLKTVCIEGEAEQLEPALRALA